LSLDHAQKAEVRLFDKLFTVPEPDNTEEGKTFLDYINPNSMVVIDGFVEETMTLENTHPYYQFERTGYFCVDKDSTTQKLVFNKTVGLKS
jgi:glutaminyl-tRNA synthetase